MPGGAAFMSTKRVDANTGNGYHGGLQMDKTFQLAYGPAFVRRYGWAHNWRCLDAIACW